MNTVLGHLLLGLLAIGVTLPLTAKRGPAVLVVSDTFNRPLEETRPDRENPIHYFLFDGMQMDIGGSVRGADMPSKEDLGRLIHETLESQGFRRTQVGGPVPEIVVIYTYGTAVAEYYEWDEDEIDTETGEVAGTTTYTEYMNGDDMMRLVGAARARSRSIDSITANEINAALNSSRVYITLAALEANAFREGKHKIIWRTRMSIDSNRRQLPDFMNVMLASAAPFLGAETDVPVFMSDNDRREIDVQIGDLQVVEEDAD